MWAPLTVTLIPGRRRLHAFRSRGVSDFTTIEGRNQTSVFFRSPLDQKEAIGVVFRSMDPPQAILEPRRVRVTLIPGSTLLYSSSTIVFFRVFFSSSVPSCNFFSSKKFLLLKFKCCTVRCTRAVSVCINWCTFSSSSACRAILSRMKKPKTVCVLSSLILW